MWDLLYAYIPMLLMPFDVVTGQELVAEAKFEEEEFERELADRRAEILRENQKEVQRVRDETADEVIDAAKQFALDRRKLAAEATKQTVSVWRTQRSKNTADHLKSARANRADVEATRAHAKKLRERLVAVTLTPRGWRGPNASPALATVRAARGSKAQYCGR